MRVINHCKNVSRDVRPSQAEFKSTLNFSLKRMSYLKL